MVDLLATDDTEIVFGGGEGNIELPFLLTVAYTGVSRISVSPYKKSSGSYSSYTLPDPSLATAYTVKTYGHSIGLELECM